MTDYAELVKALRDTERVCRDRMDGQVLLDAAAAIEELLSFAHYVADKVTMSDEDWEDYHEAFTEVACRKLAKLGVISVEDDMYVYRQDEPKEVQDKILEDLRNAPVRLIEPMQIELLPKRGEWKKISNRDDGTADYECSACHGIIMDVPNDDERPLVSYCPMCGARMTVAARCKYMDKNGFCLIISDSEVREHCVEGPCRFYKEVQDESVGGV